VREIEEVIDRDVLPEIPVNERTQKRSALVAHTLRYLGDGQSRQEKFFGKIGVDERITRVGKSAAHVIDFWFLSKAVMEKFGVRLIIVPQDYVFTDTSKLGDTEIVYLELDEVLDQAR
jgi:hypothetical protein